MDYLFSVRLTLLFRYYSIRMYHIFPLQTIKKLFSVWADASTMKHVSYEQHKYLTEAILICVGHLTDNQCAKFKQGILMTHQVLHSH